MKLKTSLLLVVLCSLLACKEKIITPLQDRKSPSSSIDLKMEEIFFSILIKKQMDTYKGFVECYANMESQLDSIAHVPLGKGDSFRCENVMLAPSWETDAEKPYLNGYSAMVRENKSNIYTVTFQRGDKIYKIPINAPEAPEVADYKILPEESVKPEETIYLNWSQNLSNSDLDLGFSKQIYFKVYTDYTKKNSVAQSIAFKPELAVQPQHLALESWGDSIEIDLIISKTFSLKAPLTGYSLAMISKKISLYKEYPDFSARKKISH